MKASEINVGDVVAVTEGTNRFDRRPEWATKAKVTSEPQGGYVGVELLEKPKSALGRWIWAADTPYKKGDKARVKTSWLWVPWHEVAEIVKAKREAEERRKKFEAEREEKRDALQARVDAAIGSDEGRLWWPRSGDVMISIKGLEALLEKVGE